MMEPERESTVRSKGGLELDRAEQFDLDAEREGWQRAPFARGNRLAETHGLRSMRATARSRELADYFRLLAQHLGVYRPAFDPLYDLAGMAGEKTEKFDGWADQFTEAGDFERAAAAEAHARARWRDVLAVLREAGMTAASFARAARDAALGETAWRSLERHLTENYSAPEENRA
jgi:hypothetical protein